MPDLPRFDDTRIAFGHRSNGALRSAQTLFASMGSPLLTRIGTAVTQAAFRLKLPVKGLIKRTIYRQFVGGETLEEAAATAAELGKYSIGVALDYGVEGASSETALDAALEETLKAVAYAATQPAIPFLAIKVTGFARFGLLEKSHSRAKLSAEEIAELDRARARILRICTAAAEGGVRILIDAEESWIQHPVDSIADAAMEALNVGRTVVYNTFQHYRHDRLDFLHASAGRAAAKGYRLGAKLVRGAYMERERARATEAGYESPIQPDKAAADRDFDTAVDYCLDRLEQCALFIGTHNEHSCTEACRGMAGRGIQPADERVHFSQLYGMSDNISFNLAASGYNVVKYLPYGPVEEVIPYLMRRARENTSVKGQTGRELMLINRELKRRRREKSSAPTGG